MPRCRLQNKSHDGNLDRQRDRLLDAAQKRGYDPVLAVTEQDSGMNDKRRGLWRVLRLAEKRGFDVLLIECPDRLARFGFRYLTEYLRAFDVRVETLGDMPPEASKEELTRDLITVLTVLSARLYGRRSQGLRKNITEIIHEHTDVKEGNPQGHGHEDDQTGRA